MYEDQICRDRAIRAKNKGNLVSLSTPYLRSLLDDVTALCCFVISTAKQYNDIYFLGLIFFSV